MEKLYLPTSSLNFNNIFSSETISPKSFYGRRNFGYKRFEAVEPNPFQNSLLLYSKYPKFEIEDYEKDNYPMVFEIPKSLVLDRITNDVTIDGIGIYQLASSVYLNPFEVKVFFASKRHYQTTLIKSQQSLETKLVAIYKPCFLVEDNSTENFVWSKTYIDKIEDVDESENINHIEFDKKVNRIKGFAYCYLIGANSKLPSEIVELKRLIKEIRNITSGLVNIYQNNSTNSKKGYYPNEIKGDINGRLQELNDKISRYAKLYEIVDPQKQKDLDFEIEILKKFDISDKEIEKVLIFLKSYKSGRYSLYEHFQWAIQNLNHNLELRSYTNNIEQLSLVVNGLFNYDNNSQQNLKIQDIEKVLNNIQTSLLKLENEYHNKNKKMNIDEAFVILNLRLTNLIDEYLKGETNIYQGLINTLIDIPIDSVEHFKSSKADIALICGKVLKEYVADWENSKERTFINSLLDNIESYQPFDLKSHSSKVLQSFAAFIIKGEEPEKLIDFLISNSIEDFRLSLGLWGSTFGFASIPRTLTENFISSDAIYINSLLKNLSKQLFDYEISSNINSSIIEEPPLPYDKTEEAKQINNSHNEIKPKPDIDLGVEKNDSKYDDRLLCPECGSEMKLRNGKYNQYYGCSRYPECKGRRELKELYKAEKNDNYLSSIIMEYIEQKGHSKISDLLGHLIKEKNIKRYNVGDIESYIKHYLSDKLELRKKGRAKGVKIKE